MFKLKSSRFGFTLVEIMVAMVILVAGLLGVLALFPVGMDASKRAGDITQAGMLAQMQMEEIKENRAVLIKEIETATDTYQYPSGYPSPPPAKTFSGDSNFSWRAILSLGTISNLYKVDLAVYWVDLKGELAGGNKQYSYEDFVTYLADYE